jgi:hypothetical protein
MNKQNKSLLKIAACKLLALLFFPLLQSCAVDPSEVLPNRAASYESKHEYTPWNNQYAVLFESLGKRAKVNKPINLCKKSDVLYVKMHNHSSLDSYEFQDIVMSTLEENVFFDEVVTSQPTIYINVRPEIAKVLPDGGLWYDTDDPLTIGQIRQLYPEQGLMILEVRMQQLSKTGAIVVNVSLIDPSDGSTIVLWGNTRSVWYIVGDSPARSMMEDINTWLAGVDEICECQCLN